MNAEATQVAQIAPPTLIGKMAARYSVDPHKMLDSLKATCFKGNVTNEQMMSLLVVAEQYQLNPWTREIYAFPDSRNGIVPVVGVDGWSRIINSDPNFDGMDFADGELDAKGFPAWIECTIYRKDRSHPIKAREYMQEVYRDTGPWKSHPRRMLRHKAMIQCARLAFGFVGVYDPDEAERITEAVVVESRKDGSGRPDTSQVPSELIGRWFGQIVDTLNQDKTEDAIAVELREIDTELCKYPELYSALHDKLANDGVISKAKWNAYLKIQAPT